MFEVRVRGVKLRAAFSFFAAVALMILTGSRQGELAAALTACVLHELGHLFFMMLFGKGLKSLTFYGGGIKITAVEDRILPVGAELVILLAGCGVNFLTAGLWRALNGADSFFRASLALGAFNLMPFGRSDGSAAAKLLGASRSLILLRCIFILSVSAAVAVMSLGGELHWGLICAFFFICIGSLTEEIRER